MIDWFLFRGNVYISISYDCYEVSRLRILHTSDLHLRKKGDQRWSAFEEIIQLVKREAVDVLVIAGDMFDKGINGEELRPEIRKLFENANFTTLILPGNHDYEVFEGGHYWGNNVKVITDYKKPYKIEDVDFWGLPFEDLNEDKVLERIYEINELMSDERTNILIFHGELIDAYGGLKGFGDEGEKHYMPVKRNYFANTKIKYVLAGHFHTRFDVIELPNGGYFIYPGSPVSITTKEQGKRKLNILEVGDYPKEYTLNTFHYEYVKIHLDPFDNRNPIDIIDEKLKEFLDVPSANYKLLLHVSGYMDLQKHGISEQDINSHLNSMKERYGELIYEISNDIRDLSYVLNNELFKDFVERLNSKDYDEDKKRGIIEYVLKAMMGVLR